MFGVGVLGVKFSNCGWRNWRRKNTFEEASLDHERLVVTVVEWYGWSLQVEVIVHDAILMTSALLFGAKPRDSFSRICTSKREWSDV